MLLEEIIEVQKPSVIYKDNQGAVFLENNRKVGIFTKHIDICHQFLRDVVEDKYIDIQYITSEDNPEEIITNSTLKPYFVNHVNSITEGEIWELVGIRRENVNNTRVVDDFINCYKTEYSSHTIADVVDG